MATKFSFIRILSYNTSMIFLEIIAILIKTIISISNELLKAYFSTSHAIDYCKELLVADIFGVPVVLVSFFFACTVVVRVVLKVYSFASEMLE